MAMASQSTLVDRMMRAAKLEPAVYEEVEHDESATTQAALVVVIGSVAAGIGAIGGDANVIVAVVIGTIVALIGWAVYAGLAYFIGTRLFGHSEPAAAGAPPQADWGQLARALGFANAPRVLLVLGVIPIVGFIVGLIVAIWVLVATIIALREALDVTTVQAVITGFLAWLVQVIVMGIFLSFFL